MSTSRFALIPAFLGLSLVLVGPTPAAAQEGPSEQEHAREVVVHNRAFLDMHVYVVQSGQVTSLGMVTGLTDATFALPRSFGDFSQEIRLLADPIGGFGSYLSEPVIAHETDQIELTIENNLDLSNTIVTRVR